MKSIAILFAVLGVTVAGAAAAADHLTDTDYLKANRCRGLAEGLGSSDASSLDTLVKAEGRSRVEIIYERGKQEQVRAKRDAASDDLKERLNAELNGPCMALLSGAKSMASAR